MKDKQFVFLNYISRSGSTLFCRLLDEYQGIDVGIEAGFSDSIYRLLPIQYEKIDSNKMLNKYLDELYNDIRFKEWKISRDHLLKRLNENDFPLTFKEILQGCMDEYFSLNGLSQESSVYVHKAGDYIDILDDVKKIFPGAKNIYQIRDPRAIYNSQKNATCIYTGKKMGWSLTYFVWQYKKRIRIINQDTNHDNLLSFRYEDLVKDTHLVMSDVLKFIGNDGCKKENYKEYSERIPGNQQQLHENVAKCTNENSLDKWKDGLEDYELAFIQKKLSREMEDMQYPFTVVESDMRIFYRLLNLNIQYWILIARMSYWSLSRRGAHFAAKLKRNWL